MIDIEGENLAEPAERVELRLAARRTREEKRRRRRKRLLAAGGALLLCATVAAVLWFALGPDDSRPTVPGVVGMSYQDARRTIEAAGLSVEVDPSQDIGAVDDASVLTVEGQDPGEGSSADRGTLVTVVLKGVPERAAGEGETAESAVGETGEPAVAAGPPEAAPEPEPAPQPAPQAAPAPARAASPSLVAPIDGPPLYPYTMDASMACGHWPAGSQDYPYFGAARDGGSRMHAGVDLYPAAGVGAPVRAMKDGTVIKVAVFYTRYTGEATYGVLVDHGDFVANYAELQPVALGPGGTVARGQEIGKVSGTRQLHFELYSPGTTNWTSWRGAKPANLVDPTGMMQSLGL